LFGQSQLHYAVASIRADRSATRENGRYGFALARLDSPFSDTIERSL
jgi:hypothetical protein